MGSMSFDSLLAILVHNQVVCPAYGWVTMINAVEFVRHLPGNDIKRFFPRKRCTKVEPSTHD